MVLSKMKPTNAPTNKSVVSKMVNTASTSADPNCIKSKIQTVLVTTVLRWLLSYQSLCSDFKYAKTVHVQKNEISITRLSKRLSHATIFLFEASNFDFNTFNTFSL